MLDGSAAAGVRIGVCDYGVGNLRSVERALERAHAQVIVSADPDALQSCDGLVLPGVGAFGTAVEALGTSGLDRTVRQTAESGVPLLGICLGFQLLFEGSEESGGRRGLGILPGRVRRLDASDGKVPHMGWNQVHLTRRSPLLEGIPEGSHMYFVHSYGAPGDGLDVVATCDYGTRIAAACERGNVMGTQFHPEKSSVGGLRIYENFVTLCTRPSVGRRKFVTHPGAL